MLNSDEAQVILRDLCAKFEARIKVLSELLTKIDANLQDKQNISDAKLAKKLDKRLAKIKKISQKNDEKQQQRQPLLLDSNHFERLEKDLLHSAKLLSQNDSTFVDILNDMVDEALRDEYIDKLKFCKSYIECLKNSTQIGYEIYYKQLEFIKQVFGSIGENKE